MAWDAVPWFVGGGAQHSPEVARLLAFAGTGGADGVVTPGDLKVSPLSVPGAGVQVAPGAALILNRGANGTQQTYVGRMATADTVAIAATGSGSGRSDLIIAQIEDPFVAGEGWATPSDVTVGPYIYTRVISNVPAGTTSLQSIPAYAGRSAITLARVDIPASTGTITSGMITDLRALSTPRSKRVVLQGTAAAGDRGATAWSWWNLYNPTVTVPAWATHVSMKATIHSVLALQTYTDGPIQAAHGSLLGDITIVDCDNPLGPTREYFTMRLESAIPQAMRGTQQLLRIQTNLLRGTLSSHTGTYVSYDIQYEERAV